MATFVQQPDLYNFAGNIRDIILLGTDPVSFAIDGVLEEVYHPDADGRITIPLRAFFEAHSSAPAREDIPLQGSTLTPYRYSIDGEDVGMFHVLPGGVATLSLDTELFLKSNFLTWQSQTQRVTYHEPQWLRYVTLVEAVVKVKGYFSDGTDRTISLQELSAGQLYQFDCNYGSIRGLFDEQPLYFDIWVEDSAGSRLSFLQRYVLAEEPDHTADFFVFENTLGGLDTIRFTGDKKEVTDSESLHALFDSDTLEYGIDFSRAWTKQTGYFPDERTRRWAQEFFSSRTRYHVDQTALRRIYLTQSKIETTRGELAGYEFTFAYCHDSKYLNLVRGELPERLEIVGLGDELFFNAPS